MNFMRLKLIFYFLVVSFFWMSNTFLFAQKSNVLQFDTSKTAILQFVPSVIHSDTTYKPTTYTQNDIYLVESLFVKCVNHFNKSLGKKFKSESINLKNNNYRKQLIFVKNKKGEKEVWVNCFCETSNANWKTEFVGVSDGGNCYFNLKINLATKKYYNLRINGEA